MQGTRTGPSKLRELVVFSDVEKVLRDLLALEDSVKIKEDTKLIDLGVEPINILDIYHRLGMDFSKYTSGERLNEEAVNFLRRVGKSLSWDDHHYYGLSNSKTTNDFINQLLVKDLVEIHNYEVTH